MVHKVSSCSWTSRKVVPYHSLYIFDGGLDEIESCKVVQQICVGLSCSRARSRKELRARHTIPLAALLLCSFSSTPCGRAAAHQRSEPHERKRPRHTSAQEEAGRAALTSSPLREQREGLGPRSGERGRAAADWPASNGRDVTAIQRERWRRGEGPQGAVRWGTTGWGSAPFQRSLPLGIGLALLGGVPLASAC